MSKTFLTQCPHCNTRFRVNSQQLFAAQGAVRCGSCMQVFNARLFLEQDDGAPPAAQGNLDSLKIHDDMDLDLDSPDFEQELARLARQEAEENDGLPDYVLPVEPDAHDDDYADEDAAVADPAMLPVRYTGATDALHEFDDYLDEAEPEIFADDSVISAADEDHDDYPAAPFPGQRHEPQISSNDFDAIDDGPLMLEWQPGKRNRGLWLWTLLCLLAALGLALQYTYYNLDQLARQPAIRPWLQTACSIVGCQVPERVDVSLITSSNLVVRPHAEFAHALSVDAIIYNRAGFSQPFPLLQLNFMDDNQQVLASRNFRPAEYLGGELAGRTSMPAQTPIRIALDVLVPDVNATSYNLKFLSPE